MQYSKDEKEMWLEDWRRSGQKAWTYAKANGISPQTFTRWTKTGTKEEHILVEIPSQVLTPITNNHEILIEKGDVRIHIPLLADCGELRAVMEGLGKVL